MIENWKKEIYVVCGYTDMRKRQKKSPAFQPGNYRMVALTGFEPVTCRV